MNNAYYDGQLKNMVATQSDEQVIDRLKQIEGISDSIAHSEAWQTLLKDSLGWKNMIDEHWQDQYDEKQLSAMRVAKQAYKYILDFPEKYAREVKALKDELESRLDYQKTEEEV